MTKARAITILMFARGPEDLESYDLDELDAALGTNSRHDDRFMALREEAREAMEDILSKVM